MEVSNEIKQAVAGNTEESTNEERKTFKKRVNEKKENSKPFVNLEGTLETFKANLETDSDEIKVVLEDEEHEYENIYCQNDRNASEIAQRLAWYYTKFYKENVLYYNVPKLIEAGVKIVINGNELEADKSQRKFIIYRPESKQLEMYVMGRLALDCTGRRIRNLRGIKKIGVLAPVDDTAEVTTEETVETTESQVATEE